MRQLNIHVFLSSTLTFASVFFLTTIYAEPQGGVIVSGQGSIAVTDNITSINQQTGSMIIDWNSFNVAPQETVNFIQPSTSSIALNRIFDQNPSEIFGAINANGRLFLSNPNGIIFGQSATVNVGALVATGLTISDEDFINGNYLFNSDGYTPGAIINHGLLSAAAGGSITLIGGQVTNAGYIVADYGHINLATGNQAVLNFDGDGLINIQVSEEVLTNAGGDASSIINAGGLQANGGQILLDAHVATDVFTNAINNEGVITAQRIDNVGGEIYLTGNSGTTIHSGRIDASGETGEGGTVFLLGERVGLFAQASIDASGSSGGGTVLVGGDYQGSNQDVQNASLTYVGSDVSIAADAIESGNGGKVIIWGDDATYFYGGILSRGGAVTGNGGFVEVSGKQYMDFHGSVDTTATNGDVGTLLLDPADIVILNGSGDGAAVLDGPDTFAGNVSGVAGTVLSTDVTPTQIYESELEGIAATTNIELQATNNITINDLTDNFLGLQQGSGNSVTFNADADNNDVGAFSMNTGDTIQTAGGSVIISAASVTAGNISTQGTSSNTSTAGGAVTVTATSGLISIGDIFTTGGTDSNSSGSNGGDVTITGTGGAITLGNIGSAGGGAGGGGAAAGGNAGTILLTQSSDALLTVGNITGSGGAGSGGGASGTNAATTLNSNGGTTVGSLGAVGAALGIVAIKPDANDNGTDTVTLNGSVYNASSITVTGTAANSDTLLGPNLSNIWAVTTSNAGSLTPTGQTSIGFSNMANLTDNGAGNFNMGTAGSVTGTLSAVGGTLDYSSYTPAVNYIHGGGAGSTGITGINSGFTTIIGNGMGGIANMNATAFDLSGATAGTAGGISYSGFTTADTTTVTSATGFDDVAKNNQGITFANATSVTGTGTIANVAGSFADDTLISTASGVDYAGFTAVTGTGTALTGVASSFNDGIKVSGSGVDYSGLTSLASVAGDGTADVTNSATFQITSANAGTGASGLNYTAFDAASDTTTVTGANAFNHGLTSNQGITFASATSVTGTGGVSNMGATTFDLTGATAGTAGGISYSGFTTADTTTVTGATGFNDTTLSNQGITFANATSVTGTGAIANVTGSFADDTLISTASGVDYAGFTAVTGTGTALTGVASSFNDGTKVSGSGVDYSGLTSLASVAGDGTADVTNSATFQITSANAGTGASGLNYTAFDAASDTTTVTGANAFNHGLTSNQGITFVSATSVTGTGGVSNMGATTFDLSGATTGTAGGISYSGFTTADTTTVTGATGFDDTALSNQGITFANATSVTGTGTIANVTGSFADDTLISSASSIDYAGFTAVTGTGTALTGVASSFNDGTKVSGSGVDYSGLTSLASVAGDGTADVTNSATFQITSANAGTGASGLNYTAFDAASDTTTVTGAVGFDDATKVSQGMTFAAVTGTVTGTGAITGVAGDFNDTTGVSSASTLTYSTGFTSVAGTGGDVTGTASFALTGANAGTAASGDTYTGFNAASDVTTVTGASDFDLTSKSSYGMTFSAVTSVAGTGTSTSTVTGSNATYNLTGSNEGNDGAIFWTSFANLTDDGAGIFNMGSDGSVTGTLTSVGGTLDYSGYITAVNYILGGTAGSTGIGGTNSGFANISGNGANSNTITGTNASYLLDATIADKGSSGGQSWTNFKNITDTAAANVNFNTAGSVTGNLISAATGTLDYSSYATAVNYNLDGTVSSTGIAGTNSGFTTLVGNGADSTLTGSAANETFIVDGVNSGNIDAGAITFSGFAHLDGGNGTDSIDYVDGNFINPAFSKTGGTAATGFTGTYITNDPASMTFAGMEAATHAGLATFNLNLNMADLGSSILDVRLDAAGINIVVTDDGSTTTFLTEGVANVSTLIINGDAGDNVLTLDFINGTPFNIAGGLIYNGDGGSDSLVLNNAAGLTAITHNFTNANDGNIKLDGATVGYTGLESITDNLAATDRTFNFAGGNETINLADVDGSDGRSFIDSTLGAAVTFANPATSLTINGGSGIDTIQFNTLDALWNADITINGGDAIDTVDVQTAMNAGAASAITINSEIISGIAGAHIAAGSIALNTVSGIGTVLSPLETATENLTFASTAGGIYITNTMASDVTVTGTTTGVIQLAETSGNLIIGAAGINSNGNSISLLADGMNFTGNIDAGAADVKLTTFDTARGILIGAGASNVSTLGISDTMLNAINTSTGIIIGSTGHAGGISVVGSTSLASGTLNLISQSNVAINSSLTTNGTVTLQSTLGDIIFGANTTLESTAGGIVLDANNSIAGSGALTLAAATDLTYNKPMVIDGITTITADALNLQSDITTTTGSLNLNSTNPITFNPNISLTAAGALNINAVATGAGNLSLNAGGNINLLHDLSANGVLSINASTGLLKIDGVLATTGGNNMVITARDIELNGSMDSAAGTISITDAGNSIGLGFNQTGRLNININEFEAMTGAGITLNTANDIKIEGSFVSTSIVPLTLNAGTITMPTSTTVNLASSLDLGNSALTAASSLDIIVADTFAMNNTIETSGAFTLSAGQGVFMGAPSSITASNQLIDITASNGDILLGLVDAGTANVNLTASAGSVLNNNGVFVDVASTLTNIKAHSTSINASDRIGVSSTDAITIDTNPAGLITLDFNAEKAYINDLNSTRIVNNGSGTVAIGLIFSSQIIGVGHNVGLNANQTETVSEDQTNIDSYISVLGADYKLSAVEEEEEDSSSLNNVVPVMIRTRDGWEFKAPPRRPANQQGQERKVDWL